MQCVPSSLRIVHFYDPKELLLDTSMYPIEVGFCVVDLRRSICSPPFSTAGVPVSPDRW